MCIAMKMLALLANALLPPFVFESAGGHNSKVDDKIQNIDIGKWSTKLRLKGYK